MNPLQQNMASKWRTAYRKWYQIKFSFIQYIQMACYSSKPTPLILYKEIDIILFLKQDNSLRVLNIKVNVTVAVSVVNRVRLLGINAPGQTVGVGIVREAVKGNARLVRSASCSKTLRCPRSASANLDGVVLARTSAIARVVLSQVEHSNTAQLAVDVSGISRVLVGVLVQSKNLNIKGIGIGQEGAGSQLAVVRGIGVEGA